MVVSKEKIAENGEYNLTGERYRESNESETTFQKVRLGDLLNLEFGSRITKKNNEGTLYPVYGGGGESFRTDTFTHENDVVISRFAMSPECVREVTGKFYLLDSGFTFSIANINSKNVLKSFVVQMLLSSQEQIYRCARGHAQKNIDIDKFKDIKIPLPPIEVQREIIAEIEKYRKIIDGARQVVNNWKPYIDIDSDWPMVELGNAPIEIIDGDRGINYPKKEDFSSEGYCLFLNTGNVRRGFFNFESNQFVSEQKDEILRKGKLKYNDIVLTTRGTVGNIAYYNKDIIYKNIRINSGMVILRVDPKRFVPPFVVQFFLSDLAEEQIQKILSGSAQPQLPIRSLIEFKIPLPSIDVQEKIVAEIEAEQKAVDGCRELIALYEGKIKAVIERVWGKDFEKA